MQCDKKKKQNKTKQKQQNKNKTKQKELCGITVKDKETELSQYADDKTLIDGSEESLPDSLKIMEHFGNISSHRVNDKKTEALWIGARADWDFTL